MRKATTWWVHGPLALPFWLLLAGLSLIVLAPVVAGVTGSEEVPLANDGGADDDELSTIFEQCCGFIVVLVIIMGSWSYFKRYFVRQSLERELEELHRMLSGISHSIPVQGLEQAYLAPGYRALADNNHRGMKLGLRLVREGQARVQRLGGDVERIRQVLSQAQAAYRDCRATGAHPDPEPLKQAQAAANRGLPASEVYELANRALDTYRGFLEVCEEVNHTLDELAREIERVRPYLAVDQARTSLDQGKAAWMAGKIDLADRLAYGTLNQLRTDLKQAEPELVAKIERKLPAGLWYRTKLKISNVGRAHAREVRIRLEGIESQPLPTVERLPAGETAELEVALRAVQAGTIPLTVILTGARVFDNGLVSCEQNEWLEVGNGPNGQASTQTPASTSHREWRPPRPPELEASVRLLRETEFYRGFVRVKVAAHNQSNTVVTDAAVELLFDEQAFRLDHIEPEFRLLATKAVLGNLGPGQKRTLAFYLDPLICTSSQLDGTLVFKDIQGKLHLAKMRSKQVEVVCPIFVTPESANVATLTNLVGEVLEHSDSRVYNLPPALRPAEAFTLAREILGGREILHVRNFCTPEPYTAEAWYYGKTKVKGHELVMRVAVEESTNSIEIFAAAPAQEPLTGLLAELGHDLHQRMEARGWPVKQITNVTIRDSVLNRTSLLFNPPDEVSITQDIAGTDDPLETGDLDCQEPASREVNIRIEDSMLSRTTIAPELDGRPEDDPVTPDGSIPRAPEELPEDGAPGEADDRADRTRKRKDGPRNSLDEGLEKLREIERELS